MYQACRLLETWLIGASVACVTWTKRVKHCKIRKRGDLYRCKKTSQISMILIRQTFLVASMSNSCSWMTVHGLQLLWGRMGQNTISYAEVNAIVPVSRERGRSYKKKATMDIVQKNLGHLKTSLRLPGSFPLYNMSKGKASKSTQGWHKWRRQEPKGLGKNQPRFLVTW